MSIGFPDADARDDFSRVRRQRALASLLSRAGELHFDRERVARLWFDEEFTPVVEMLRNADLLGKRTEAEAYLRLSAERYRLLRSHAWSDEVIDRLRRPRT